MNAFGKASLLAVTLTVGASVVAGAQEKACEIEEGRPNEVARAMVAITQASGSSRPDQTVRSLQQAVKYLTDDPAKIDRSNQAGRNYVLGKAYVLWMQQPNIGYQATRGQLGFSQNQDQPIDLVAATDSAFDIVVQLHPECANDVEAWRQQQPWVDLINGAIQQFNAGQLDSAEALIRKSMVLTERNPFGPNLMAAVAQQRQDFETAIAMRRKTIELAQGDTAYDELRQESMYNLGALLGRQAELAEGPEKMQLATEAANLFEQFVQEAPDNENAVAARAGIANMRMLAGDTAAVERMYADQIANPTKYSDMQLVQAGVVAARAEKATDAAKLFEAALSLNANNRDALYNLAASYWAMNEFEKMFPLLQRLITLDPNNPDNYRLIAYGFQGKQKAVTEGPQRRALNDSIVKYVEIAEQKLPAAVAIDDFTRGVNEVTLGGRLENRGDAAGTFTVTVEFLDGSGAVVGTQQATVGPVNAKDVQTFSVTLQQPGVVAWRYKVGT